MEVFYLLSQTVSRNLQYSFLCISVQYNQEYGSELLTREADLFCE